MINNTAQPVSPININQTSIDTHTNIFKSLSGGPLNNSIGTMVIGSDSLQVKGKINFNNLKSIIKEYYDLYSRQTKGSSKREREEDYIKRVSDENYILISNQ